MKRNEANWSKWLVRQELGEQIKAEKNRKLSEKERDKIYGQIFQKSAEI